MNIYIGCPGGIVAINDEDLHWVSWGNRNDGYLRHIMLMGHIKSEDLHQVSVSRGGVYRVFQTWR